MHSIHEMHYISGINLSQYVEALNAEILLTLSTDAYICNFKITQT